MNDDFLVSLGLELYQEFQQWNYSLIDNWLNSIELLEKDLQPLARLHLAVEDLSEITDLFRDWEAWLTADFVPSLRSKNGEMSSLERDSSPVDLGVNTSSFMSFSRQSLASASDYTQPNPRVRTSNYPPLQKEQENSYNIRQKKQISFDDNHQANNIYPQNNATKSQRELTDLVRDISGENLPLDSDNLNSETTPWQNPQQKTEIESNNPSGKNWQELTDLVRDISGENLPLDSDNLNLETTPWQNSGQKTEPKNWQELNDLVRDISSENLPLDSDNLNSEITPWENSGQKTEIESNNPSPKNWQELTDLVRDISGENLPLDSDNLNSGTTPWKNFGQKTEIESNNPSPKNWQELTDLVRDISGDNLPLDSATAANILSQSAEMLPISSQVLQQSREKLYHQINNINSNFSNIKETELEINKQESENQSFNQHPSLQDTEQQAIDLDYILETLQTKINQEYRRFYGG
ncbi:MULTISPECIES: hypothetical protein [unclassified Microcystis]|uniref:hypothetical protein n=1 Tax=unclassified Microcystis TaxID=2643300 RepID=UPI00258B7F7E|nr:MULTISPECIES: hypothetical protein [unclassified Microcystis]MCA2609297.1 hypothetical protein [Microcystis sp. M27BS1]MCA2525193.1 hypothetical protein [Microcystis sp. M61BS1]MCA2560774.1 hypothetical protein [Microcystis sp. M40BS1]MCA2580066.1 hypothetical protein [Microcystis sp. M39BS1]MCA2613897.1 hypothetical protein [Microcystis sp. M25BS1]